MFRFFPHTLGSAFVAVLVSASTTWAACSVPNTLTNGQTADATQVMGNFNAVVGCVNNAPAGAVNAVQTNAGSGAFGGVGPLQDGQLVVGTTGGALVPAYLTPGAGITITNAPGSRTVTATTTPGAGASGAPEGRLTLTSGSPVMSADVVGATTVFYDCYAGKGVPYYNGTADLWGSIGGCEISTALQASGTGALNGADVFDVFYDGVHICVATNGAGAGWSGDTGGSVTARGSGYSSVHNVRGYVTNAKKLLNCYNGTINEGTINIDKGTYLGSLFTTAAGQTSVQFKPPSVAGGTANVVGLWNAYNREMTTSMMQDSSSSAASGSWGPSGPGDSVSFVSGLALAGVKAVVNESGQTNGSCLGGANVGLDLDSSTATPDTYSQTNACNQGVWSQSTQNFWAPMVGFHTVQQVTKGPGNFNSAGGGHFMTVDLSY